MTQRPTKNSLILASYTYSKEQGNFPGLFSTETGQLDPNALPADERFAKMARQGVAYPMVEAVTVAPAAET